MNRAPPRYDITQTQFQCHPATGLTAFPRYNLTCVSENWTLNSTELTSVPLLLLHNPVHMLPPDSFHLVLRNTELIVGKQISVGKKKQEKLSDTEGVKQSTEKHFSILKKACWVLHALITISFPESCAGPQSSYTEYSPTSFESWIRVFISVKLGSGEWEAAAPSSGSSTLVTVKCGIAAVGNAFPSWRTPSQPGSPACLRRSCSTTYWRQRLGIGKYCKPTWSTAPRERGVARHAFHGVNPPNSTPLLIVPNLRNPQNRSGGEN